MRVLPAIVLLALGFAAGTEFGCRRAVETGPPEIRYGDSVCVHCDMIISDERFATALVVDGPRGREPRLFDDMGDMLIYEAENPHLTVLERYVHDYGTRSWIDAGSAVYLHSPGLHTPMASGIAAFADRDSAEEARAEFGGELLALEDLPAD